MAFHLQVGGNTGVVIGGAWNSGSADAGAAWSNPFANVTSLTMALTVRPDVPFSESPTSMNELIHQWGGSASQGTWQLGSFGNGTLVLAVYDGDDGSPSRNFLTAPGALVAGQWNRIMIRWSGSLDQCQITNNAVDCPTTKTGHPVTALQNTTGLTGPWEIGAISWRDDWNLAGDYAEVAGWLGYLADIDAVHYGQGYSPDLLPSAGRLEYVDLRAFSNRTFFSGAGEFHANTVGRWTGTNYGVATMLYGTGGVLPYQGYWSVASATPAAHPQVFGNAPGETPLGTPAAGVWWDDPVHPILPQRGFESWEFMGEVGQRSGCVLTVATGVITGGSRTAFTANDIQGAMNSAQYGDDVVVPLVGSTAIAGEGAWLRLSAKIVDAGGLGTTPRCPPRGRTQITGHVPITGSTPITGSLALTAHSADPSYIHVYATGAPASLPAIIPRNVFMPDGTVRVVYDGPSGGSCRVTSAHIPVMATVIGSGVGNGENAGGGFAAHHWAFRGLYFALPGCGGNQIVGDTRIVAQSYGQTPNHPDHIMINQCGYNGDPNNDGHGGARVMEWEGEYIAQINGFVDNFHAQGGGENVLTLTFGACYGPLVFRNNAIPLMMTQSWFSGGGNSQSIGVEMQDCQWMYNWQSCPPNWRLSEVNPLDNPRGSAGWVVTISSSDLRKVTCVSGGLSNSFGANGGINRAVYSLCTMYETATGRARLVSSAFEGENLNQDLFLDTAWPGGAGTYSVYFQMPSPNLLYNSGADDLAHGGVMPTATVSNGSTAVTFSAAVPQYIKDAVDGGFRPYFYLNNLHWEGGWDSGHAGFPTVAGHSPTDNGYTYLTGVTYANCRRKKIVAMADLTHATLENPYIVLGGEVTTFPYSIVCNDGLFRPAHLASKGAWETKCGASRMEWVGNVEEYILGGGTMHLNVNSTQGDNYNPEITGNWIGGQTSPYTFTCSNDLVTVSPDPASSSAPPRLPDRYPGNGLVLQGFDSLSRTFNPRGLPRNPAEPTYPYLVVVPQNYAGNDTFWSGGRIVRRVIDMAHLELEPIGGLNPADAFQCPVGGGTLYAVALSTTAWRTNKGFTHAYNVTIMGSGTTVSTVNEGTGEINHGGLINFHDNVYLLSHDPSVAGTGFGGPRGLDARSKNLTNGFGTWSASFAAGTGDQSFIRYSRNSFFQTRSSAAGLRGNFYNAAQENPINVKAHHIDVLDNLVAEYGPGPTSLLGQSSGAGSIPLDPVSAGVWVDPVDVRRNVFGGGTAPADIYNQAYSGRFPDNAGVPSGAIGFVSYDTGTDLSRRILVGATDPMVFTGYALAPIDSTGTVSVSADGLTVTKDSAAAFNDNVAPGAFLALSGAPIPIRIQSIDNSALGAQWDAPPTGWARMRRQANRARATAIGVRCGQTFNGVSLTGDQYFEITIPTSLAGGIFTGFLRFDSVSGNGYRIACVLGGPVGVDVFTGGDGPALTGTATAEVLAPGKVLHARVVGSTMTVNLDGVLAYSSTAASAHTSGKVGLGMFILSTATTDALELDEFKCGNIVSGSPVQANTTETFGTIAVPIVLASALPAALRSTTGNAFAVTFQGTATDGRDPGANLSIVEQLTRNVRGASTFVAPPPDTEDPVLTITSPTASTTFDNGATSTVTLGGTATDNVGVTFISWANAGTGGSGTVAGTGLSGSWTIPSIALASGSNAITATAHDGAGRTGADTLTVTYTPAADAVNPVCTITTDGGSGVGANFSTGNTPIALAGTATDNVGVTSVTWACDTGGSGSASLGTPNGASTTWAIAAIALTTGANVITVTAHDAQGNTHADTITVTKTSGADTTPPVPAFTLTSPHATATSPITIAGTATDDVVVDAIHFAQWAGTAETGTLVDQHFLAGSEVTGLGTASATFSLPGRALEAGPNTFRIVAYDFDRPGGIETGNSASVFLVVNLAPISQPPVCVITGPTSSATLATQLATLTLSGTATDDVGVTAVTWANITTGATGAATVVGTTSATWSVATPLTLQSGDNTITATAHDADGSTHTDTLTVTYTPDVVNPVCTITTNSGANFGTNATPVALAGTASDAVGVTSVTWSTDQGFSGTATGTTTWAASITLLTGANVITVTAHDAATNVGTDTITVTYTPDVVSALPVVQTFAVGDTLPGNLTSDQPAVVYFSTGKWRIRSGAAELENAGTAAEGWRVDRDLGVDDYLVTMTLAELAGAGVIVAGPCARMQGDATRTFYTTIVLIPTVGTPTVSIQRFIETGGSIAQVQLGPSIPVTAHAGMTLGIWPLGSRIRALVDNVVVPGLDLTDTGITTGHFMGGQGVANVNNRVRVSRLAATVDNGPAPAPAGFEVTIRVPGTTRPTVTIRPAITAS